MNWFRGVKKSGMMLGMCAAVALSLTGCERHNAGGAAEDAIEDAGDKVQEAGEDIRDAAREADRDLRRESRTLDDREPRTLNRDTNVLREVGRDVGRALDRAGEEIQDAAREHR